MAGRTIAIGDVHGYAEALAALVEAIRPGPDDTLVTLGDYVDRGPDVQGTLGQLMELSRRCQLVPLLGNHDEMLLEIVSGHTVLFPEWLAYGGTSTLMSYGCATPDKIPTEHLDFLKACRNYYQTATHLFVHANYREDLPLEEQPLYTLRWETLRARQPGPHYSGKKAVVGHTAQKDFRVLDLGYLTCIDTCCYGGGWLTALDVQSGQLWQADAAGRLRTAKEPSAEIEM